MGEQNKRQNAPAENRTRGSTMATLNFTTKPLARIRLDRLTSTNSLDDWVQLKLIKANYVLITLFFFLLDLGRSSDVCYYWYMYYFTTLFCFKMCWTVCWNNLESSELCPHPPPLLRFTFPLAITSCPFTFQATTTSCFLQNQDSAIAYPPFPILSWFPSWQSRSL